MSARGADKAATLVTRAAYARSRGISKQRVQQLVDEGRLTLVRGKVDPEKADAELADAIDPRHEKTTKATGGGKSNGDAPGPSETAVRLRRAQAAQYEARAERERIDLELRRGQLVNRDLAVDAFYTLARTTRDALLNAAPAFATKAAAIKDRRKLRQLYEDTVKKALAKLSGEKLEQLLKGKYDPAE